MFFNRKSVGFPFTFGKKDKIYPVADTSNNAILQFIKPKFKK